MSTFVLCVGCGEPLYGFSPCRWCTCKRCGVDLRNGTCPLCHLSNSCADDHNLNSFDCPPDSYHPPHPTYETYSGDFCGNDSQSGYHCHPQFPLNYEPEPGYTQNYNSCPHDSPSFPQQYPYCEDCGNKLMEQMTSMCEMVDQFIQKKQEEKQIQEDQAANTRYWKIPAYYDDDDDYNFPITPNETVDSLIMGDKHLDTVSAMESDEFIKSSVENLVPNPTWDRVFKIKDAFGNKQYKPEDIQELFRKLFNDVQNIHEELAKYINTSSWNRPAFYNNEEDDDKDYTIAITPDFPITDSLRMGDEHLSTIPEKELDELIKFNVENLVPNP
nr:hypothetical protein [Tanacetum cinerariifolium]